MSDPIHNPPSYYLLPDGTEIREMIRQARGDESTIEHLTQSIMEYAGRLGKKPGASRADDFRKIARNAIQGANVCEGRSVSDNGDPPTGPADPDLGWVAGYVRRNRILHLYGRSNDLCDDIACGGQFEAALVGGVQLHPADKPDTIPTPAPPTNPDPHALATAIRQAIEILTPRANCVTGVGCDIQAAVNTLTDAIQESPAPTQTQPPEPERPSITLPVVFGGDQIPASGVYLTLDSRGSQMVNGWAGGYTAPSTMIGPIPSKRDWPKRFEREGEDA